MVRGYAHGVTLTELLIVITIIGLFATSVIPLGTSWVAKTQIEKTERLLVEAYNKATTEALKNPNGVLQTAANPTVATLSVNNTTHIISVVNSANTSIWQVSFPEAVSIAFSPSSCTALKINNIAAIIDPLATSCSYTISRTGASNVTGQL